MRKPRWRPWTAEDVQQLRELAAAGIPAYVIASKLRRTREAILDRARTEGITLVAGRKRALGGNKDPAPG